MVSKEFIREKRIIAEAEYIIKNHATTREAAKAIGVCKQTVYVDMTERLIHISQNLFNKVKDVMEENKKLRHINGGLATKSKYERLRGV